MINSKEVFDMELRLFESINKEFFEEEPNPDYHKSEDDQMLYMAYSAVQDLKKYLQEKEGYALKDRETKIPIQAANQNGD